MIDMPGHGRGMSSKIIFASALTCGGLVIPSVSPHAQSLEEARPAISAPPSVVPQGWSFFAIGRADLTLTDNAYLTAAHNRSDIIMTPAATLNAHETGAWSVFDASVDVAYDFYSRATDLSGLRVNGLADGTVRFPEQSWSLRGRAATNLAPASPLGLIPATERTIGGNQIQVVTYGLSPGFQQPLTDTIRLDASYDFSGVNYVRAFNGSPLVRAFNGSPLGGSVLNGSPNFVGSDSILQKAQATFSNRIVGALPLEWSLVGTYDRRSLADGAPTSQHAGGEADIQYAVTPLVALLGSGGYEWFDEPTLTDNLTGAYFSGGFLFRPTSRTSLRFEAGYRYGKPDFSGEFKFSRSQRLEIVASYHQGVSSTQGALDDTFARTARDLHGILIDPLTGLAPAADNSFFDLNNQAYRFSSAHLSIQGVSGRNFYRIGGSYDRRTANGVAGDSWSGQFRAGRNLTPALSVSVEAEYIKTAEPYIAAVARKSSETITYAANLTYQVSRTISASARFTYLKQSTVLVKYRENAVLFSLSKRF